MKIFSGTTSKELTEKINDKLQNISGQSFVGKLKIDKFLDGETLPIFEESVRNEDVFFVQTTNTSDSIVETLLVIDAAKRAGCKSFTLIAPYQGYSRQDKNDHLRSSIGSKMLAGILESTGMTSLISIDFHASQAQAFYNVPVIHLNGNKIFIDYIKSNRIEDLTIVAPDQGAVRRASDFCKAFPDATFAMINKKRIKPNEIHSMELVGDVSGRNVVIVDDIADTLGTMKKATDLLIEKGAKSVRCIATHGVLSGKAMENLKHSQMTELLVSDSIPSVEYLATDSPKMRVVSCADIIAKTIWSLTNKKSIHEEINVI
jgi:ribose-phosphate pyrophosphokinase